MKRSYNYHETKKQLESQKSQLCKRLTDVKLTESERNEIKRTIDNYEYILNLVEMNHFERGISH
ncbi:hypothetical protein CN326_18600 [Bacillus sp. AFS018417]|uniref:DUF3896 family protein n=1 Tax=Bacillus TaxID=1386 RepID=UPI000BF82F1B|nr:MULTISPECIES: DUF3896 family protein [unclassified Bacillus (in: firmicutes)]MCP1123494.1 DUF3896 domain-containing protein [Bacillus sp. 3103sda1]PEZ03336.1 hypothetical protein CN326_18600 [Bacillus sp. AFS018417]